MIASFIALSRSRVAEAIRPYHNAKIANVSNTQKTSATSPLDVSNHHYSKCTKEKNSPPICVNCNENHPANYRGCKIYKQIKNKKSTSQLSKNAPKHITQQSCVYDNKNTQHITNTVIENPQNQTNPNTSNTPTYAEKTKNKKNNLKQDEELNNSNITNELIKSIMPLISTLVSQIIKKFIEYLPALLNNINVV